MKISKINGYSFLRNDEKGYLIQNKKDEDKTVPYLNSTNRSIKFEDSNKETLERIKVSYINKIFKNSKSYEYSNKINGDKDKIYHSLVELIYYGNIDATIKMLKGVNVDNLCKNLSSYSNSIYGKYTVDGKETKLTLQDAFISAAKNSQSADLNEILKIVQNKITKRKENIKKSIENNKTPFIVDEANNIMYLSIKGRLLDELKKDMIQFGYTSFFKKMQEVEKEFNLESFIDKYYQNNFNNINNLNNFRNNLYSYKKEVGLCKDNTRLNLYILTVEEYFKKMIKTYNPNRKIDFVIVKKNIIGEIKNAITQQMINEGKIIKYFNGIDTTEYRKDDTSRCEIGWIKKEFNSTDLIEITSNETTTRKIIEACVFATNNLANIMNLTDFQDILTKSNFQKQLSTQNISDKKLAKLFFNIDFANMSDDEYKDFLWAVRGSIQSIRNQAYHNTKDALNKIFNIQTYEIDKNDKIDKNYADNTYLRNLFVEEIDNFNSAIKEKFKGMKLFDYFTIEFLNKVFKNITINPFEVQQNLPSFNKLIERGQNIIPQSFLKMTDYDVFSKNNDEDLAIMNLHKVLYEYDFKNTFLSNETLFAQAVSQAIERKKKDTKNLSKMNLEVLKDFKGKNTKDIQNYLADLQSAIMLKSLDIKDDKTNAYYLFLLDITAFGFDNYIKTKFKDIDLFADKQTEKDIDLFAKKQTETNFTDLEIMIANPKLDATNENIAFFTFGKLLNNDTLNELQQKLIKFQQNNEFQNQIKILEVCKLKNDNLYQEEFKPKDYNYEEILKTFVSDDVLQSKCLPYYDDKNPIIFKEIYLLIKYGTLRKISIIFKDDKVTLQNLTKLSEAEESIVQDIQNRDNLHRYILENKACENTLNSYIYFVKKVNNYNDLKNKVNLTQIYKAHTILCKVLAKPINFIGIWDKNFVNIVYSYCYELLKIKPENELLKIKPENELLKIQPLNKDYFYKFIAKMNDGIGNFGDCANKLELIGFDIRKLFENIYLYKKDEKDNWKKIRDKYAHLNLLKNNETIDLKTIATDLRNLFIYERNSKNKITRAFRHLLERNNLDLDFKFKNDKTFNLSLASKQIVYFKNIRIPSVKVKPRTDFCSADYVCKIEKLLSI